MLFFVNFQETDVNYCPAVLIYQHKLECKDYEAQCFKNHVYLNQRQNRADFKCADQQENQEDKRCDQAYNRDERRIYTEKDYQPQKSCYVRYTDIDHRASHRISAGFPTGIQYRKHSAAKKKENN